VDENVVRGSRTKAMLLAQTEEGYPVPRIINGLCKDGTLFIKIA
jgi:hypothetical protein